MTSRIQNLPTPPPPMPSGLRRTSRGFGKASKNKNQKTISPTFFWNTRIFNIILICLIILSGFLYLTQVNAAVVKGYIMRDLEMQLEETQLSNKKLELQSQAMQSVGGVMAKVQDLNMVTAEEVEYLQMPGGEVAVAK